MVATGVFSGFAKRKSFPRGVHPEYNKELSRDKSIKSVPLPAELIVPVQQHIGSAANPVVKPRDEVKLGQLIAESTGFVSAPIHSPVNGKVGPLTTVLSTVGKRVSAITIKPEGVSEEELNKQLGEYLHPVDNPRPISEIAPDQIVESAHNAGLVGLGGATFPTHVKLKVRPGSKIDTVILNGCECEPYLTADDRLMREAAKQIIRGFLLAIRAVGAERGVIGIEDNKPEAIESMREAIDGLDGVEIAICKTQYPMGGERQLIKAVLGRIVPTGGLPLDVGVVVINVGTAHSLANAVDKGKPLTHRVVTVTGLVNNPGNFLVPIGTPIGHLIECAGGLKSEARRVILGGPMMGVTVPDLSIPVTKGTSGITVLAEPSEVEKKELSCIRCARCVDHCPIRLNPTKIAHAAKFKDYELMKKYDLLACIECGCCAYVCPSKIPLVQYIKTGKFLLAKAKG